jgi:hypothetical protein
MRLSGNYGDRLLINVLPWTVIGTVIVHFGKANNSQQSALVFLIGTCACWLMDSSVIFFKFRNPKALKFVSHLSWNGYPISPQQIHTIRPITDQRFRWSFEMIEVSLTNGDSFFLIDKPRFIFSSMQKRRSRTIVRLTEKCPELLSKVTDRRYV